MFKRSVIEVGRSIFQGYAAYVAINELKSLYQNNQLFNYTQKTPKTVKNIMLRQFIFEIFDFVDEFIKSRGDWSTVMHHVTAMIIYGYSSFFNTNIGYSVCALGGIANQYSAALGFNPRHLLCIMEQNKLVKRLKLWNMLIIFAFQLFCRIPIICWIVMYKFHQFKKHKKGIFFEIPLQIQIQIPLIVSFIYIDCFLWLKWVLQKLGLNQGKYFFAALCTSVYFAVFNAQRFDYFAFHNAKQITN
eukprot:251733_1